MLTSSINGHVILAAASLLYWLAVRPWSAQQQQHDDDAMDFGHAFASLLAITGSVEALVVAEQLLWCTL